MQTININPKAFQTPSQRPPSHQRYALHAQTRFTQDTLLCMLTNFQRCFTDRTVPLCTNMGRDKDASEKKTSKSQDSRTLSDRILKGSTSGAKKKRLAMKLNALVLEASPTMTSNGVQTSSRAQSEELPLTPSDRPAASSESRRRRLLLNDYEDETGSEEVRQSPSPSTQRTPVTAIGAVPTSSTSAAPANPLSAVTAGFSFAAQCWQPRADLPQRPRLRPLAHAVSSVGPSHLYLNTSPGQYTLSPWSNFQYSSTRPTPNMPPSHR